MDAASARSMKARGTGALTLFYVQATCYPDEVQARACTDGVGDNMLFGKVLGGCTLDSLHYENWKSKRSEKENFNCPNCDKISRKVFLPTTLQPRNDPIEVYTSRAYD